MKMHGEVIRIIYLRNIVCFRYIIANTMYRGDNKGNNNNNTNNNNNNNDRCEADHHLHLHHITNHTSHYIHGNYTALM
jgi:hypothetical protein